MKYDFLGEKVELVELTIAQSDSITNVLLGDSNVGEDGKAQGISMANFKESVYLAIEYGTKEERITVDYIKNLPASKADDVQNLYDEIMSFNGLSQKS